MNDLHTATFFWGLPSSLKDTLKMFVASGSSGPSSVVRNQKCLTMKQNFQTRAQEEKCHALSKILCLELGASTGAEFICAAHFKTRKVNPSLIWQILHFLDNLNLSIYENLTVLCHSICLLSSLVGIHSLTNSNLNICLRPIQQEINSILSCSCSTAKPSYHDI